MTMNVRNRFLVVLRAGDRSLHPQWLVGEPRNWDLALSYFGDFPDRFRGQYEHLHVCRGSKWEGLAAFMAKHEALVQQYEYVWFPDDDLLTDATVISRFFDICAANQFTLAQPSLALESHCSWPITLQRPHCRFRYTDFVEIMAPCFRVADLPLFVPTFSTNASGWGLEWIWWRKAQSLAGSRFAIVDETAVLHTRPVGLGGHGGASSSTRSDKTRSLAEEGIAETAPTTLQVVRRHARLHASLRFRIGHLLRQMRRHLNQLR
jgi:hypothetical protein